MATHPSRHGRGVRGLPDRDGLTAEARRGRREAEAGRRRGSRPRTSGCQVEIGSAEEAKMSILAATILLAQLRCSPSASGSVDCWDAAKGGVPVLKIEPNLFGGFDLRQSDGKLVRCEKKASGETECRVVREGCPSPAGKRTTRGCSWRHAPNSSVSEAWDTGRL